MPNGAATPHAGDSAEPSDGRDAAPPSWPTPRPSWPEARERRLVIRLPIDLSLGESRTSLLAVVALICSLIGLGTFVLGPVGAVLGHVARKQIAANGGGGGGMARAAVVIGWVVTVVYSCGFLVTVVLLVARAYALYRTLRAP